MYVIFFSGDSRTNSPLKLGGDPPTPSKVTLDLEHLRGRCKHLQEELEGARRTLSNEREENHLKMLKLEASLNVTKKTNMELEVGYRKVVFFLILRG